MIKHYMTICLENDLNITHELINNKLEVTFSQCDNKLILSEDSCVIYNNGFSNKEVEFCIDFLKRNIEVIREEAFEIGCFKK